MVQGPKFPLENGSSHLERCHPHIVERLRMLWGYPEGSQYLSNLLVDTRGGRAGFSSAVFSELVTLANRYPMIPAPTVKRDAISHMGPRRHSGFSIEDDASRRRASF